jgi:subtilisin family serine protease
VGAATLAQAHDAASGPVAVLDSGVDLKNADLNAVSGVNCIRSGTPAQDDNGHGTNVAGILAARNSGSAVAGVAPGTQVYSVKVLSSRNTGTLSQILCGIDWVTANAAALNIRVANMSIEGAGADDGNCGNSSGDAWHKAICRSTAAGVTYVASAGNGKTTLDKTVPAAYPEVLTATAMTDTDGLAGAKGAAPKCKSGEADDRYASYSNYAVSPTAIAHVIAAPGTCVVADKLGGGTSTYYGTSQAAPHVAGTVALCLGSGGAAGPCAGLAPAQVIAKVRADAAAGATTATGFAGDPLRPVTGKYFGYLDTAAGY